MTRFHVGRRLATGQVTALLVVLGLAAGIVGTRWTSQEALLRRTLARDAGECALLDSFLRIPLEPDQRRTMLALRARDADRARTGPCTLPPPQVGDAPRSPRVMP